MQPDSETRPVPTRLVAPAFLLLLSMLGLVLSPLPASDRDSSRPAPAWSDAERRAVLEKTLEVRLAPDLSGLTDSERKALESLLRVGEIFHEIYLDSRHEGGLEIHRSLESFPPEGVERELEQLFRTFNGPIGTTLDNRRLPFVEAADERSGKNVYPAELEAEALDDFLARYPASRPAILHPRTVVRRTSPATVARDRQVLERFPALDLLHPGLADELARLATGDSPLAYYAVPYSVAWPERILEAYAELHRAARQVAGDDPDFAAYLEQRARDLLSDEYEGGDAAWITGHFGNLNAQLGSYETYDDQLKGVKTFFSASLLIRDRERSRELAQAIAGLQEIENALPYEHSRKVRSAIPVGIYHVVADFGQARGTNTATILPNDPDHARKYGRTILLRHNILTHPELFAEASSRFRAAVVPDQGGDLTLDGNFERTLWHEVGHYLGVATDRSGRPVSESLGASADLLEEMKADLVSLFAAQRLRESGYHDDRRLTSVYASGILRTLQLVQPRRTQPYQTMQLMQLNFFLDRGLLSIDGDQRLRIDYERYPQVVTELLGRVLELQYQGDIDQAEAFVDRWATWSPELHEPLAERLRAAQRNRFRRVRYAALGE